MNNQNAKKGLELTKELIELHRTNGKNTIKLLEAQVATIEALQSKIEVMQSVIDAYEKAYGSVEDAVLSFDYNSIEVQDDDFCPEEICPL